MICLSTNLLFSQSINPPTSQSIYQSTYLVYLLYLPNLLTYLRTGLPNLPILSCLCCVCVCICVRKLFVLLMVCGWETVCFFLPKPCAVNMHTLAWKFLNEHYSSSSSAINLAGRVKLSARWSRQSRPSIGRQRAARVWCGARCHESKLRNVSLRRMHSCQPSRISQESPGL